MNNVEEEKHEELICILDELVSTIERMEQEKSCCLLIQNENEAKEWLVFLKNHVDKDELKSLEDEISDRFFYKFDVELSKSQHDAKRVELMRRYISKSNDYLK